MTDRLTNQVDLGTVRFDIHRQRLIGPSNETIPVDKGPILILNALAACPGQIVTKDSLIADVLNYDNANDETLVHLIADTRQAIGDHAQQIVQAVPGIGYRLVPPKPGGQFQRRSFYRIVGLAVAGLPLAFILLSLLISAFTP